MFSKAIVLALAGAAAAGKASNGTMSTVTEVVDVYTTYCPEPTHLTMNNKTYTVTEACTFTITDCPCTVTKTVPTGGNNNGGGNNNNGGGNNNNGGGNKVPVPTTAPGPAPTGENKCPGGKDCPAPPVVGAAGQNSVAYGMAVAGALAALAL